MSAAKQIGAVVAMNISAMRSRVPACLVIVVGMAMVVAVVLSIFSLSAGVVDMTKRSSAPDRMQIFGQGDGEGPGSGPVPKDALPTIAGMPGARLGSDGKPLIYGNVNGNCYFTRRKESGRDVCITFAGVGANILEVRPEVKIIEGRMFKAGLREVIAGKGAVERFENIAVGNVLKQSDGPWTIVGVFEADGGTTEYNLLAEAETLASAQRRTTFVAVFTRLTAGTQTAQDEYKATIRANESVRLDAMTEEEGRTRAMQGPQQLYANVAYGVGVIMALGAICAALNTMYAAVSTRRMEIATLRAIGFSATPVVISVLVEALALAALGAVLGAAIAWAVFDGQHQTQGLIAIHRVVTPAMTATGIGISVVVGFIGALFPAVHAARLPVTVALQAR